MLNVGRLTAAWGFSKRLLIEYRHLKGYRICDGPVTPVIAYHQAAPLLVYHLWHKENKLNFSMILNIQLFRRILVIPYF